MKQWFKLHSVATIYELLITKQIRYCKTYRKQVVQGKQHKTSPIEKSQCCTRDTSGKVVNNLSIQITTIHYLPWLHWPFQEMFAHSCIYLIVVRQQKNNGTKLRAVHVDSKHIRGVLFGYQFCPTACRQHLKQYWSTFIRSTTCSNEYHYNCWEYSVAWTT